jgi:hypothetical protein
MYRPTCSSGYLVGVSIVFVIGVGFCNLLSKILLFGD